MGHSALKFKIRLVFVGFLYTQVSIPVSLSLMFLNNGYPLSFFDKILASFQSSNKFSQNISFEINFCIPYLGKESHHVANRLSALIKNKYNLKISLMYKTFKVVNYFQLKSKTPVALCSNVVYKFSCSCDTNKTYIVLSSRHLITRVREHLNFKSLQDSAIKDHFCRVKSVLIIGLMKTIL